jgi:NAD(P)-dependent dehydrogenase (short-subunit alcohol dehydrogenase family)
MTGTNIVIGAGSGIGAAVAAVLAPRGPLLLADRDGDSAAAVAAPLGADATAMTCDLTDPDAVAALADAAGTVGSLVITAGLSPHMGDGRRILEVDLVGMHRALVAVEPALRPGSVGVCVASMAAHLVPPDPVVDALLDDPAEPGLADSLAGMGLLDHPGIAYSVSKRGVIRLVRRRAGVWGRAGARLVSISPGVIDTPMGRLEDANEPSMAEMVHAGALRREGRPDEIAAVVDFLTSEAASYVTGTDILVDGGVVAAVAGAGAPRR